MLTVSLKGIKIHATHGLYEQEHLLGHQFEVDVSVQAHTQADKELPLMDYSIINRCVQSVFTEKEKLLETLARSIHQKVSAAFPYAALVKVCVRKINPPLGGQVAAAEVCYEA